jgi:hypothetical protein
MVFSNDVLEQFDFETLPPALDFDPSFAYACGAGGGTRRQSISTFSMLKCSKTHFPIHIHAWRIYRLAADDLSRARGGTARHSSF